MGQKGGHGSAIPAALFLIFALCLHDFRLSCSRWHLLEVCVSGSCCCSAGYSTVLGRTSVPQQEEIEKNTKLKYPPLTNGAYGPFSFIYTK